MDPEVFAIANEEAGRVTEPDSVTLFMGNWTAWITCQDRWGVASAILANEARYPLPETGKPVKVTLEFLGWLVSFEVVLHVGNIRGFDLRAAYIEHALSANLA